MRDYQETRIRTMRHIPLVRSANDREIDGYDRLIEGICRQASKDLNSDDLDLRLDAIDFFRSKWFEYLTGLNSKDVLSKLSTKEDK